MIVSCAVAPRPRFARMMLLNRPNSNMNCARESGRRHRYSGTADTCPARKPDLRSRRRIKAGLGKLRGRGRTLCGRLLRSCRWPGFVVVPNVWIEISLRPACQPDRAAITAAGSLLAGVQPPFLSDIDARDSKSFSFFSSGRVTLECRCRLASPGGPTWNTSVAIRKPSLARCA